MKGHTLKVTLYPDRDTDLLAWAMTLEALPFGAKSQAIKATLLRGLADAAPATGAVTAVSVDTSVILEALLPELRRVVESAIAAALARAGGVLAPPAAVGETEMVSELLEALGADLLLADDDMAPQSERSTAKGVGHEH
ncbi:MAG TPA: hypothetical protein PKH92_07710 [Anaerolineaceae bacterium]|nr:hypothetical protein [Anaerolineaceae bacterium]